MSAGSDAAVVVVHTVLLNRKEIKIAMISLKMDASPVLVTHATIEYKPNSEK